MAAITRPSRQQVFAATAAAVSPPSEWPATAIFAGSIKPASTPVGRELIASSLVITREMSAG